MDYKIENFNNIPSEEWDKFVHASPDGWLYQTSSYIKFAIAEGNCSLSFGLFNSNNQLMALCPIYLKEQIKRLLFIKKKIKIIQTSYSGPIFSPELKEKGRKKIFKLILQEIEKLAAKNDVSIIEIRLFDFSLYYLNNRPTFNPLWTIGMYEYLQNPPRLASFVNLSKNTDQILSEIDEDCRSEIRKAMRTGIDFKIGSHDDLKLYHEIHKESWTRTVGSCNSWDHFDKMYKMLDGDSTIKLFFAYYQNEPIAAIMLHVFKTVAFYYGGCSKEIARSVYANNYLLFSTIKWCKENNYSYFGIGIFDAFPGENLKEYTVGLYKAQFSNIHYPALEGKKHILAKKSFIKKCLHNINSII